MNKYGSISTVDVMVRCTLAGLVMLAVLLNAEVPQWLAILATYPVFTAMVNMDPVYAIARGILNSSHQHGSSAWTRNTVH